MAESKLIVASARLPVTLSRSGRDWRVSDSPGGLATALRAVARKRPFTWIGYPGLSVPKAQQAAVRERLAAHASAVPVFLSKAEHEGFYEEFSNRRLWPLFHNLTTPMDVDHDAWLQYQAVNAKFADAIAERAAPGDVVWIHDYQLMLVPRLLRQRALQCAIGFFLHIPFPASETYRTLPAREAILRGVLGADFIGFHAYEYVSHFRTAALRILGIESEPETLVMPTHLARLGVLPIGIEPDALEQLAANRGAQRQYDLLKDRYRDVKVVLGVDRLDHTKGLLQKFLAFEELLHDHPELRKRVVLIQIAAPSRMGVAEYQSLKRKLDELVGRINGRYGTLDWTPLVYINQNVSRTRLTALYRLADVALVTPVRDGMNLVCLEYIAARGDIPGTLILSEFTGAATCLSGALLVNPYNQSQVASVLAEALNATPNREAFEHMRAFVHDNTASEWAQRFLLELERAYGESDSRVTRLRVMDETISTPARRARRPLLLLDYDGTLQAHARAPEQASPARRVINTLNELAATAMIYVLSGRPAALLDEWLGALPIGLVCEHGLAIKNPGGCWSEPPIEHDGVLEEIVLPLFKVFTQRTPGSQIETKTASLAWHYRGADPKLGAWRAKELMNVLESRLSGQPYTVLAGSRVIEARHMQVTKGRATATLLARYPDIDFVFCAGNDRTDEDMFEALMHARFEPCVVCKVGSGMRTAAGYFVESPLELLDQLELLAALLGKRAARAPRA